MRIFRELGSFFQVGLLGFCQQTPDLETGLYVQEGRELMHMSKNVVRDPNTKHHTASRNHFSIMSGLGPLLQRLEPVRTHLWSGEI